MATITCTITKSGRFDPFGSALVAGASYTGDQSFIASLVSSGYASVSDPSMLDTGQPIPLNHDYTLTAADDGKQFYCTTALVVTVGALVSVIIDPPPAGNLTVRTAGVIKTNGGTADLTRTLASNPAGVVIKPTIGVAGAVGVSGA